MSPSPPARHFPTSTGPVNSRRCTDSWPYLGPTFLRAAEQAMPELKPWHTVATRARGELALLPGYIMTSPPVVDYEPRTYLGWQAPSGEEVCCGADTTP